MKKIAVAVALIISLSGCGGGGSPTSPPDSDNDGVVNSLDAFPNDSTETKDTDQDGVGDNSDAFPEDSNYTNEADYPKAIVAVTKNSSLVGEELVTSGASSIGNNITYQWSLTKPDGSTAELTTQSSSSTSFIPDIEGEFTVSLIVSDEYSSSEKANYTSSFIYPDWVQEFQELVVSRNKNDNVVPMLVNACLIKRNVTCTDVSFQKLNLAVSIVSDNITINIDANVGSQFDVGRLTIDGVDEEPLSIGIDKMWFVADEKSSFSPYTTPTLKELYTTDSGINRVVRESVYISGNESQWKLYPYGYSEFKVIIKTNEQRYEILNLNSEASQGLVDFFTTIDAFHSHKPWNPSDVEIRSFLENTNITEEFLRTNCIENEYVNCIADSRDTGAVFFGAIYNSGDSHPEQFMDSRIELSLYESGEIRGRIVFIQQIETSSSIPTSGHLSLINSQGVQCYSKNTSFIGEQDTWAYDAIGAFSWIEITGTAQDNLEVLDCLDNGQPLTLTFSNYEGNELIDTIEDLEQLVHLKSIFKSITQQ